MTTSTQVKPAVSIVMPAYNARAYIGRTIESVLQQTEQDFELIVVDDGSSDDTEAVVRRYARARYVRQANAGVSAARNHGVRLSRADLVAFLDADDLWHPEKLRLQLTSMRLNPDVLLSRTAYQDAEDDCGWPGCAVRGQTVCRVDETMLPSFLWPYFCTSTVMVRRTAFELVGGFDTTLRVAEDVDFYLRVLAHVPKVLVMQDELVLKRLVPGSLGDDSTTGYSQLMSVYDRCLRQHPHVRRDLGPVVVRQAYRRLYLARSRSLLRNGNLSASRQDLRQVASLGWGLDVPLQWLRTVRWQLLQGHRSRPGAMVGLTEMSDAAQQAR